MRKRNKNVYVRFTEAEHKELMARIKSSGLSIQSYMLRAALGKKIYGAEVIDDISGVLDRLRDMDYQLNKIGVNLNQIAKVANADGEWNNYVKLMRHIEMIRDMREEAQYSWQLLRFSLGDLPMRQ